MIRAEQNQLDRTGFVIDMSKKLKVAFGENYRYGGNSNPDRNKEHCIVIKSLHDKHRIKWDHQEKKQLIDEDRSFEIDEIYTGKLCLVKTGYYKNIVKAILPDLFGENCYFNVSKETIFDALNNGLLCEDGSFYGPFRFFIGSGNRTVSIITPRK